MRRTLPATALLLAGSVLAAGAQSPNAQPVPVLRFDVNLVQVDAVVTDHKGQHVTTLRQEDFEVLQHGRPQTITHFEHVAPPQEHEADAERQAVVLLVDDYQVEFGDFVQERQALLRYVESELPPGVRMSIVRTSGGSGAMQQFSSDPKFLRVALENMIWSPPGPWKPGITPLQWLVLTLRALAGFPGHKSVVWIGPGMLGDPRGLIEERIREVADLANRASVTIRSIDIRALPAMLPGNELPDASQSKIPSSTPSPDTIASFSPVLTAYYKSQGIPAAIADMTGGLFFHDSNDRLGQLRTAVADASDYYLLGWDPGEEAFAKKPGEPVAYHRIQIKLRPKGLAVRSRSGFYANPGETGGPMSHYDMERQMQDALFSPFDSAAIHVRLTSVADDDSEGAAIKSLLQIGPEGLQFRPDETQADCSRAAFEVAVAPVRLTWDTDKQTPLRWQRSAIQVCGNGRLKAMTSGIVTEIKTRVPVPGSYQVRAAVRNLSADENTNEVPKTGLIRRESMVAPHTPIGSATQVLDVPDGQRDKLAVSGMFVEGINAHEATRLGSDGDAAIRTFRPGQVLSYGFRAAGDPNTLQARLLVLYDGSEIHARNALPLDVSGRFSGTFTLTPACPEGDYLLGIEVSERKAQNKKRIEWLHFSVARAK